MKIIIGNQKGGVGKSSLCFLLANYFSNVKEEGVICLDFDPQLTLYKQWKDQVDMFDNDVPYHVMAQDLGDAQKVFRTLDDRGTDNAIVLMDVPGNLSDDDLIYVYGRADLIICPFHYDTKTFESTYVFAQVMKDYLKLDVPIVFVPNRIKKSVKYSKKEVINSALGPYGTITEDVYELVSMQRQSLFDPEDSSITSNKGFLEHIYNNCIKKH